MNDVQSPESSNRPPPTLSLAWWIMGSVWGGHSHSSGLLYPCPGAQKKGDHRDVGGQKDSIGLGAWLKSLFTVGKVRLRPYITEAGSK